MPPEITHIFLVFKIAPLKSNPTYVPIIASIEKKKDKKIMSFVLFLSVRINMLYLSTLVNKKAIVTE